MGESIYTEGNAVQTKNLKHYKIEGKSKFDRLASLKANNNLLTKVTNTQRIKQQKKQDQEEEYREKQHLKQVSIDLSSYTDNNN